MWEVIGRFETQEQIDSYPVDQDGQNNATVRPGDVILRDVNGDGIINDFDERPQAYASADWPWDSSTSNKNPLISMGINLGFEWKGFDVAADFAGGFKNTFVADWDLKWGVTRSVNGYYYNNIDVWRHEDILIRSLLGFQGNSRPCVDRKVIRGVGGTVSIREKLITCVSVIL